MPSIAQLGISRMNGIPEKISALQQALESSIIRQNVETRRDFEKKIQDSSKETEDAVVQRLDGLLAPQISSMAGHLQGLTQAAHQRADEAYSKITEFTHQISSHHDEVAPLLQRADSAAAQLDRLSVESSTAVKDCADLRADFTDVVAELRAKIADETSKREEADAKLMVMLAEASQTAANTNKFALVKAEDNLNQLLSKMTALELRFHSRLDETAEQSLRESKLGGEDVMKRLRSELLAVNELIQKRFDESQEKAEDSLGNALSTMRGEFDAAVKHSASASERHVEQMAQEITLKNSDALDAAKNHSESVRESCGLALNEASTVLRKAITDTRVGLTAETQTLRQLLSGVELRASQATEEAGCKAVEMATKRLQDTAADIRNELQETKQSLLDADETLRQNLVGLLEQASGKLERSIEVTAQNTASAGLLSLGQAVTQLRSELAEILKAANERTDQVRCQAADALSKEVCARREALSVAEAAREAILGKLREEIQNATYRLVSDSEALTDKLDHRVDLANQYIQNLQGNIEHVARELSDSSAALLKQLKVERQRTEEMGSEASRLTHQVQDTLEAHLQNETTDIRREIADARKKIYEETTVLRAELREQPTKREFVELASTATEQYNELNSAIEGHRFRLEAVASEHNTRLRETKVEMNEARLRMQQEAMALGSEITTLRSASSSLANGVLKALQVIGVMREDVETASGSEGVDALKEKRDHHLSIEIEDLLEWEKLGKSLAARIARQWYVKEKESTGIVTMLSLVERKAEADEILVLKELIREYLDKRTAASNGTNSTMTPYSPISPKTDAETPPRGVSMVREQRLVGTDTITRVL